MWFKKANMHNFLDLIKRQKVADVKRLLKDGIDPNIPKIISTDPYVVELFPLIVAVKTGNLEIVKLLIAHGAKVDVSTISDGQTPLHTAFFINGDYPQAFTQKEGAQKITEMVHYLVSLGADINAEGGFCLTPFLLAIDAVKKKCVDVSLLQYLIDHGADVNKVLTCVDENKSRTTALGAAIEVHSLDTGGHPKFINLEIFALLIKNGADPSINPKGFTPLQEAFDIQEQLQNNLTNLKQQINNAEKIVEYLKSATQINNNE